jgi:hypothetical protein
MLADDDGFVSSPRAILRQCGATQDDMLILLQKRFLLAFDSGIIVIKHWRINNYLQSDRKKATTYKEELRSLMLDENNAYTEKKESENPCIQNVYNMYTQDSIDKNSLDKNSIGESKEEKQINNKNTHRFGVYSNVILTQEEYALWMKECPKAEYYIDRISEYIQKGKVYPSHLLTMRKWWNEDKGNEPVRSYDLDEHTQRALSKPLVYKKKK